MLYSAKSDLGLRASVKRTYDVYYALRLPPDVQLNFKDVPRTSEISFVRPKSIPETSKNCQKARPLLTSCMMFAPPTYRKFATCVDWALRTSHFTLAGVLLTAVSSVAATFWWLRDHCVYFSRVLSWLIDVYIIKFSTGPRKYSLKLYEVIIIF